MREKSIEQYLVTSVKSIGGMCVKFPAIFHSGFPDRIILLSGGRVVFVETKAPKGQPSSLQKRVHTTLRGLGFRVEVIESKEVVDMFINTL